MHTIQLIGLRDFLKRIRGDMCVRGKGETMIYWKTVLCSIIGIVLISVSGYLIYTHYMNEQVISTACYVNASDNDETLTIKYRRNGDISFVREHSKNRSFFSCGADYVEENTYAYDAKYSLPEGSTYIKLVFSNNNSNLSWIENGEVKAEYILK